MTQNFEQIINRTMRNCEAVGEVLDEDKIVETPSGNTIKSLPMIAREAEQATTQVVDEIRLRGGYFKTYNTLAEANADIANIPFDATVKVRDALNGGDYYKATSGATNLTKSPYDPVRLVVEQLDERVERKHEEDAEILVDQDGQIIRRQTPSGDMYLAGLEGSIQKNIQDIQNQQKYDSEEQLFRLLDVNDRVVFSILANGDVVTASGNLNQLIENLFIKLSDSSNYELSAYIDASLDVLPANYSIDAASLVLKSTAVSSNYIKLDTPYRDDDGVVHPCVIQLNKPMLGFKYWMCITPYGNLQILEENPCIYGSNDLDSWTLIKGIEQPLDNPPDWDEKGTGEKGFLSDCFWVYDHKTCELYCCYRKCYTHGPDKYNDTDIYQLLYRKTRNGLNWSEPEQMFPDTLAGTDEIASPSIVWDETTQKWVMYAFDDGNRLYMRTNDDFRNVEGWSARIEIGFQAFASANSLGGWHLETRWVGDRLFMLINDYRQNGTLYFAYADKTDLSNWTFSNTKLVTGNPGGCYKASFITEESGASVNIHVFWTDSSNNRKLRKFTITEGKI